MKNFLRSIFLLFLSLGCYSQHEQITDNWKTESILSKENGIINYHVYKNEIDKIKPVLLFLDGSGNFPLYFLKSNGKYSTSTTLNFKKLSNSFHIALISKPGIPFVDTIKLTESERKYYPTSDTYKKYYSLNWRVNAGDLVINDILKKFKTDTSKIIVWGHSEGSQVAPAIAVKNSKVTHVISMMGNSLNQLYDFIINERISAEKGKITNRQAQSNIDSLFIEYEKIYKDPESITKEWFGETYYKWSSFTLTSPIENMLKLDIPILYVAGGADNNQNIINMDYARLEFLRKGKTNLTYKVFPNYDHYFLETKKDSSGKSEWIDHLDEVNQFSINWINQND